jgi:hypothetical protein
LALFAFGDLANAQIAVTDVAAINQSAANQVQTIARLIQQVQQMEQQLAVAQQSLQSITGTRSSGQAILDSGVGRQSLPANFASTTAGLLTQGTAGGSAAAQSLYGQVRTSPCSGWQGAPNAVAACQAPVILMTSQSATVSQALQSAQARLVQLQGLADAANTTGDTKGAADLQARIAAEQAQLLAEKTMLDYAVQTQRAELQLAVRHQADLGTHIVTQAGRACYICP